MSKPGDHKPFPPLMGDAQSDQTSGHPDAPEAENLSGSADGVTPNPDAAAVSSTMHPSLAASLQAAIRMRQAQENNTEDAADADAGASPEENGEVSQDASIESMPKKPDDAEDGKPGPDSAGGTPSALEDGEDEEADEDGEEEDEYEDEDEEDDEEEYEDEDDDEEEEGTMSLRDHLRELRKRVVRAFLFALLGFFCCYPFAEEIYGFLLVPLLEVMPPDSMLIYTSVPEAFFTYLKVAFFVGIFAASPFIFYQMWAFIAPGLYREEKLYIVPVAVMSGVCFIGGGAFCFFVVFPIAFEFFMSYNVGRIQAMPSLKEYLSFVLQLIFAFGLVFEMPLFIFFLARLGLVTAPMLRKFRRYMILICFIVAAILTPPDVLSQLLMAGPMLILYEGSIFIAAAFGKKAVPPAEDEDGEEDGEDGQEDGSEEEGSGEEKAEAAK